MALVAVAEVVAELHVGRDAAAEPHEPLHDAGPRVGNHVAMTPSSMANSKFVSHWTASWSCGIASKIVASSVIIARLVDRLDAAWSSAATNAAIGASGVGSDTWNRQCDGISPSRLRRANVRYDEMAACA